MKIRKAIALSLFLLAALAVQIKDLKALSWDATPIYPIAPDPLIIDVTPVYPIQPDSPAFNPDPIISERCAGIEDAFLTPNVSQACLDLLEICEETVKSDFVERRSRGLIQPVVGIPGIPRPVENINLPDFLPNFGVTEADILNAVIRQYKDRVNVVCQPLPPPPPAVEPVDPMDPGLGDTGIVEEGDVPFTPPREGKEIQPEITQAAGGCALGVSGADTHAWNLILLSLPMLGLKRKKK